jgi:hypothetical protein
VRKEHGVTLTEARMTHITDFRVTNAHQALTGTRELPNPRGIPAGVLGRANKRYQPSGLGAYIVCNLRVRHLFLGVFWAKN